MTEPTIPDLLRQLRAISAEVDTIRAMEQWSLEDKEASAGYARISKQLLALSASLRTLK